MAPESLSAVSAGAVALPPGLVARADRHPVAVYLARLAPGSRRTMRQALETVAATIAAQHTAETLPWPAVGYQHAAAVRAALLERGKAPATVNKTLAALRGVLKECWRLGLVDGEHYQRAADVQGVRASTLPRGRALDGGDLMALMRWCAQDDTPRGSRDAALLALLYGGGLRRSEAVAAALADYDPQTGALTVRPGKGDKRASPT
jgi:site-specific recombinase XerD